MRIRRNTDPYQKDTCLCGVHLHNAAKVVASIALALSALSLLIHLILLIASATATDDANRNNNTLSALYASIGYNAGSVIFDIITLIVSALLLYAVMRRKPALYWPFLIWMGICIVCLMIYIIITTIGIIMYIIGLASSSSLHGLPLLGLIIFDLLMMVLAGVLIYFFFLVPNNSRKLMGTDGYDNGVRNTNHMGNGRYGNTAHITHTVETERYGPTTTTHTTDNARVIPIGTTYA